MGQDLLDYLKEEKLQTESSYVYFNHDNMLIKNNAQVDGIDFEEISIDA